MSHIIQCRLCKTRFDTEKEEFVLVGKRSYYHKKCYEEWVRGRNDARTYGDELFWRESVIDYLYRDVKMSINFSKLDNQWNNFIKPERKMTPKGIYFALRYYYDVMKGSTEKALGGIGIVPSIYADSARYWENLEMKKAGTIEAIIEQIKERQNRPVQTVIRKKEPKKDKSKFSLDDI
jgi:hypothetical protein